VYLKDFEEELRANDHNGNLLSLCEYAQ
jgi:hypothetical protein